MKPAKNLTLNTGVNNLFNKTMIYSSSPQNDTHMQALNDVVGRYLFVNLRYTFK